MKSLILCGNVARSAPYEMAKAELESQEQERSGAPYHGGLDLSQEGRVRLPPNPAALYLAYNEAAVALSDAAVAAAGGRASAAAADPLRVPSLSVEAHARGALG